MLADHKGHGNGGADTGGIGSTVVNVSDGRRRAAAHARARRPAGPAPLLAARGPRGFPGGGARPAAAAPGRSRRRGRPRARGSRPPCRRGATGAGRAWRGARPADQAQHAGRPAPCRGGPTRSRARADARPPRAPPPPGIARRGAGARAGALATTGRGLPLRGPAPRRRLAPAPPARRAGAKARPMTTVEPMTRRSTPTTPQIDHVAIRSNLTDCSDRGAIHLGMTEGLVRVRALRAANLGVRLLSELCCSPHLPTRGYRAPALGTRPSTGHEYAQIGRVTDGGSGV